MHRFGSVFLLPVALAASGCVLGTSAPSPYGRQVTVLPAPRAADHRVSGELIAVSVDSLWVLAERTLVTVPLAQVDAVHVARHRFTPKTALVWTAVGGLLSATALTVACGQVADDCGYVFPGVLLSWGMVGGLSAVTVSRSANLRFDRTEWDRLRPYARFPQGIPEGFPRTP